MSTPVRPEATAPTPLSAEYDAAQTPPDSTVPPARLPAAAPSDATHTVPVGTPDSGGFLSNFVKTAVQPILHPIDAAESLIRAPIEAGHAAMQYLAGKESGVDALKAQLPVAGMLAFGPVEGAVEGLAARAIAPAAARIVGGVVAGAVTGPAFNPKYPTLGAAVGGLYGLLGAAARVEAAPEGVHDPVANAIASAKSAVKAHVAVVADEWNKVFAPANRSPQATIAANILRSTTGHAAGAFEQVSHKLDEFRRAIEPLPDADKLSFIDAIEGGRSQPTPEFADAADAIRGTLNDAWTAVHDLGPGHLDHFIKDYFPHVWDDPELAAEVMKNMKHSSMEGSEAFRKERQIPTTAQGMALGLKPVSMNPVDLTLIKLRQIQKYLMAHQSLGQMKEAGVVKYVPSGVVPPDGFERINDKIATVFGPRTGAVTLPEGSMTPGEAPAPREMVPIRDEAGKLRRNLGNVADAHLLDEWRNLAELNNEEEAIHSSVQESGYRHDYNELPRTERLGAKGQEDLPDADGTMDPDVLASHNKIVRDYNRSKIVRASRDKAMGRIEAEMGRRETPGFQDAADAYHKGTPGMRPMLPSDVTVSGLRIMGQHYAPEPVARVVNNYLSPGLTGHAVYDAYRGLGNNLNQAQLGLSALHLMFASIDATVSRVGLGLEYLMGGAPVEGFKHIVSAPLAPITNMLRGQKIRAAYLDPAGEDMVRFGNAIVRRGDVPELRSNPDEVALANAVKEAGGRIKMDGFYRNSAPERMITAWRAGEYGKATALSLPAFFEAMARPIMEHIVPLQKLGVFGDMAKKVLADLPEGTPLSQSRAELARAWDSVDNRMGQLVYDNLFWNKTFKDLSMASVRSVGWNIGTIRELGGGIGDLASAGKDVLKGDPAELTHRASYVITLPLTVGFAGATYQYLRTGHGPSELKDYFYPKTGEMDADGNPERVQLASYMKDVFSYSDHPFQTVKNKASPILGSVFEMLGNKNFYGDEIRNPNDPAVKQIAQEAAFMGDQMLPFSIRNMNESMQRGDKSAVTKFGNWFGVMPAPRSAVRSDAQNQMDKYLSTRVEGATPEDVAARQSRAEILAGLRGNTNINLDKAVTDAIERHELTAPDVVRLLARAGSTPMQERFKRLTLPEAIQVFKKSTDREKDLFAEALLKKVETFESRQPVDEAPSLPSDAPDSTSGQVADAEPPDAADASAPASTPASAPPVAIPVAKPAAPKGGLVVPVTTSAGKPKNRIDLASIRKRIRKVFVE